MLQNILHRVYWPAALTAALLLLPAPVSAQNGIGNASEVPGKWRPFVMESQSPDWLKCASRKDWGAMIGHLREVRAIWERIPSLAAPIGYEVAANGHYEADYCLRIVFAKEHEKGSRPYSRQYVPRQPVVARLSYYPFSYFTVKGKLQVSHESHGAWFHVNKIPIGDLPNLRDAFVEPVRVPDRFGVPTFAVNCYSGKEDCSKRDDLLILRHNDVPLWMSVKLLTVLDELLDKALFAQEGYERSAQYKARQGAPLERAQPGSRWADTNEDVERIGRLRLQVANSQPDAPAWICQRPSEMGPLWVYAGLFRPSGGPGCQPVVQANPDYFNRSLPVSAVQLVTVNAYRECLDRRPSPQDPGTCTAHLKLLQDMDWNAVRAVMGR